MLQGQEPRLMVYPGDPVVELLHGHVAVTGEQARRPLDAVAQPDHPQPGQRQPPGEDGHGVGVLQDQGARAQVCHVLDEAVEDRQVAQATKIPTRADGVAHTLVDPVLLGDAYVGFPLAHAACLDGDDHVVGPGQVPGDDRWWRRPAPVPWPFRPSGGPVFRPPRASRHRCP